jgi:hypothetical protein
LSYIGVLTGSREPLNLLHTLVDAAEKGLVARQRVVVVVGSGGGG